MYLSKKTSIDFVAHHEIQFQACRGVYEELMRFHDCRVLIGQNSKPSGAEAVVLVDHGIFQPKANRDNYRYLIHMNHDLADLDIYANERKMLSKFDLILVPGPIHYQKAISFFRVSSVFKIGWPKLEVADANAKSLQENGAVDNGSAKINILYAPSYVNNREWVELLPELIESGHHILVKNHIYYDFDKGIMPPKGEEEVYKLAVVSLLEMERYIDRTKSANVEYFDRRVNLCSLFNRADVLITDSSSASLEFLSYGLSVETGRYGLKAEESRPCTSLLTDQVKYLRLSDLVPLLKNNSVLQQMIRAERPNADDLSNPFIFFPPHGASKHGAALVDLLFYLKQNGASATFPGDGFISRLASRFRS